MKSDFRKIETSGKIWLPKTKGEEVIGIVSAIVDGQYGKQYDILTEKGEDIRTPSHKVLQNRMVTVKKGDTIKIVFTGTDLPKVKGNNPTSLYDVYIKD